MSIFLIILSAVLKLAETRLVYRTPGNYNMTGTKTGESLRTSVLIEAAGCPAEVHMVVTEDGYIIEMQRLPADNRLDPEKVVVLTNGFAVSSNSWFVYSERSFPAMLHRNGYDVWIVDFRGATLNSSHVSLTQDDPEFWQYSIHEMGYYDTAAGVDYALKMTGAEKLYLVGHSQGTTANFIFLSLRPEYNPKIKLLICFGPVAYLSHLECTQVLVKILFSLPYLAFQKSLQMAGAGHFYSANSSWINKLVARILKAPRRVAWLQKTIDQVGGPDSMNSQEKFRTFLGHYPGVVSVRQLGHYIQLAQKGSFQQYDFGKTKNLAKYNNTEPPTYPLEKITAPTAIYRGTNDFFVSMEDYKRLKEELPNIVEDYVIENFNHLNFIVGSKADSLLYEPVMECMKEYQAT